MTADSAAGCHLSAVVGGADEQLGLVVDVIKVYKESVVSAGTFVPTDFRRVSINMRKRIGVLEVPCIDCRQLEKLFMLAETAD